jgi:hypothetical protein
MIQRYSLTVAGAAPELPCPDGTWRTGFPFHPEYGGIQGTWCKIVMLQDFREAFSRCQGNLK